MCGKIVTLAAFLDALASLESIMPVSDGYTGFYREILDQWPSDKKTKRQKDKKTKRQKDIKTKRIIVKYLNNFTIMRYLIAINLSNLINLLNLINLINLTNPINLI